MGIVPNPKSTMTNDNPENLVTQVVRSPVSLVSGATYPLQAVLFLNRHPHLWGYVIVPIVVNFIVGIALYVGLLFPLLQQVDAVAANLSDRLTSLVAKLPQWLSWLGVVTQGVDEILQVLAIFVLLLLTGFLLVQFGTLIGSPWYGQLSEQLEKQRLGQLPPNESVGLGGIARDIWRAILFEVKKLVLAASLGIGLLLLNVVPALGTIAASLGGVAIAALMVCFDFLDAPLERRRLRFREKLRIILSNLPASGSFSLACLGLVTIPVVNFVTIPLCVAAGTLFFCDRIWSKQFAAVETRSDS
jgi:CysZ protein